MHVIDWFKYFYRFWKRVVNYGICQVWIASNQWIVCFNLDSVSSKSVEKTFIESVKSHLFYFLNKKGSINFNAFTFTSFNASLQRMSLSFWIWSLLCHGKLWFYRNYYNLQDFMKKNWTEKILTTRDIPQDNHILGKYQLTKCFMNHE